MEYNPDQYQHLFRALLEGKLPAEEAEALLAWLSSDDPAAVELITNHLKRPVAPGDVDLSVLDSLEKKLPLILKPAETPKPAPVHSIKRSWLRYAAILILALGAGGYFLTKKHPVDKVIPVVAASFKSDIPPAKNGAILTLSDGRAIVLDSLGNGVITDHDGSKIMLKDGKLVYGTTSAQVNSTAFNTITTPKGRQFQVVLPDGSKVWLNAESSLRYPVVFAEDQRRVELEGEAYFEVSKNPKKAFKVALNKEAEITVLGTHFNVNSYNNEPDIRTTLLEGSVQVSSNNEKVIIKPGEQARVTGTVLSTNQSISKKIKVVNDVDMDKVMAWKNGIFDFQDATLQEVMKQLERWYDIDVVYEGKAPSIEFVGKMSRDLSLLNVLDGLEISGVHFRLEQPRKLVIMP